MNSTSNSQSLLDQLLSLLIHSDVLAFQSSLPVDNLNNQQVSKLYRQSFRFLWRYILEDDEKQFPACSTLVTTCQNNQQVIVDTSFIDLACGHLISLEFIRDWLYKQFNSRHYDRVPLFIRQLYALASLYHCILQLMVTLKQNGQSYSEPNESKEKAMLESALHTLDMGLLYCPPLCNNILAQTATIIHDHLTLIHPFNMQGLELCDPTNPNNLDMQMENKWLSSFQSDKQIPCLDHRQLDFLTFQRQYFIPKRPVLIRNAIHDWPAMQKWNLEYLLNRCGARSIPVEIGQKYTDTDWKQKVMTVEKFVNQFIVQPKLVHQEQDLHCPPPPSKGYCAQYELFDRIECLANDFSIPDYCGVQDNDDDANKSIDINAWFGPENTVSPLHHDPKDNIFAQVLGRKYVRLYSSDLPRSQMYVCGSEFLNNTSEVDVEHVDRQRFPDFPDQYLECIVRPGDLLYIPKRDWHYVRSLDVSFSISFWWNEDRKD